MAGLWAISLGIDPRFPTFSLYSVCRPPNSTSPRSRRSKGQQGQRALQWTLRSAAWLDPRWVSLRSSVARVSWTHKRTLHSRGGGGGGGGVQKASSALATAFHSCIYWNSPVLLYCCYCCFHGIYHQHLSPLILEVAAASEAAIEASSLSTIY